MRAWPSRAITAWRPAGCVWVGVPVRCKSRAVGARVYEDRVWRNSSKPSKQQAASVLVALPAHTTNPNSSEVYVWPRPIPLAAAHKWLPALCVCACNTASVLVFSSRAVWKLEGRMPFVSFFVWRCNYLVRCSSSLHRTVEPWGQPHRSEDGGGARG